MKTSNAIYVDAGSRQTALRARRLRRRTQAAAITREAGAVALAAAVLAAALLALAAPLRAAADTGLEPLPPAAIDHQWKFRVFVDDKEVGFHDFRLDDQGERRVLESIADFEYRLLFVPIYRYEHENREVWDGDCLAHIESRTDANGKDYAVAGERREGAFRVDGSGGEQTLPACVMSFAYWNPDFLEASRLLNTQNGEYLDVEITGPERAERVVGGEARPAWRYRLTAKKLDLALWYSDAREWLGLETTYENGRTLRYELVTEPQVAAHDAEGGLPDPAAAGVAAL